MARASNVYIVVQENGNQPLAGFTVKREAEYYAKQYLDKYPNGKLYLLRSRDYPSFEKDDGFVIIPFSWEK